MPKYICGATSDIGVGREQQEDFVQFCELDEETLLKSFGSRISECVFYIIAGSAYHDGV